MASLRTFQRACRGAGAAFERDVITAVFIGGAQMSGGVGKIIAAAIFDVYNKSKGVS